MKRILRKVLILMLIINSIGIILEGAAETDNGKAKIINNPIEKDRLETIKEKGVITVASALDDVSFFYVDNKTNKISGIDADIIVEIAKRLGINKVEMKKTQFSNLLERLITDDSIDIAAGGMYITPKREELVTFTQPLYKESEVVVVPQFSKINFMNDLKDAVVGVEKGTAFVDLAEDWKKDKLIKDLVIFPNTSEVLQAINNNKIDAGLADSVIIKYSLIKNKNLLLRVLQDYTPKLYGNVGIPVRKSDTALLNALNEKIKEMKADGTLYAILIENGLDKNNMILN